MTTKLQIALIFAAFFTQYQVQAQTLEGRWQGHYLSATGAIPADAAFRWDAENNWGFYFNSWDTWTSFHADLQIAGDYPNLVGTYRLEDKSNPESWGTLEFIGSFDFASKKMTWHLEQVLEGSLGIGKNKSRPFTYSQEGAYEYLRGRWKTEDGYHSIIELRRSYSGTPLQEKKTQPLPNPPNPPIPQPKDETLLEYSEMNHIGFEFPSLWNNSRNDNTQTFTSISPDNSMLFSLQRTSTNDEKYLQNNIEGYLYNLGIADVQWKSAAQVDRLQKGLVITKELRFVGRYAGEKVEILVWISKVEFWDTQQLPMLVIAMHNKTAGIEHKVLIDKLLASYRQSDN